MKTIINILLCLAIAAGMTSCGNSGNKSDESDDKLSHSEKKELKEMMKDLSDKVEIKGDKVIRTTKAFGGMVIKTTYHFTGDKCTRLVAENKFPDKKTAEKFYNGNKEVSHLFDDIKMEGNTVTYVQSGEMLELGYGEYTKKSLRDKLQKEIDDSKEIMDALKDEL